MIEPAPESGPRGPRCAHYERVRVVVFLDMEGGEDMAVHAAAAVDAALEGVEVPGSRVLRKSVQL